MKTAQQLTGIPLIRYGFVHVTGLPTNRGADTCEDRIEADNFRHGRHDYNNGVMVVITHDGEVWIRHASDNRATETAEFMALLDRLCPNGKGARVPCSNGESIPFHAVMTRISDPYWIGYEGECRFNVPSDQITNTHEMAEPVIIQ